MKRSFLITVATAALIAGAGLAAAQDSNKLQPSSPGSAAQAPAEKSAPPMKQGSGTTGQGAASESNKPAAAEDKAGPRNAQDMKSKGTTGQAQDTKSKSMDKNAQSNELKANGKAANDSKMSTDSKTKSSAETKGSSDNKMSTDTKTEQRSTTGQGAAATSGSVNLTTEQRTKITSVIREQKVAPVTNVNFSISIGTRVPRSVRFHPLPASVVEVYPQWRGYEFILVNDQIVIINPRTYEIVFILEA